MTAETSRTVAGRSAGSQPMVNTLSIVSVLLVAMAGAGIFIGGGAVTLVFAVGTGHVALQQIKVRHERGAILAYIALGISYLFATYALVASVYFGILYINQ